MRYFVIGCICLVTGFLVGFNLRALPHVHYVAGLKEEVRQCNKALQTAVLKGAEHEYR